MSARIGIVATSDSEIAILLSLLENAKSDIHASYRIHTGLINNTEVAIIQSGHGKVAAAIAATLLIEKYQIALLISTGVAGSLNKRVKHGDLVVASELSYHDLHIPSFALNINPTPLPPSFFLSDDELSSVTRKTAKNLHHTAIHQGLIVSGDQFIQNAQAILKRYPDALAVDTQSAAIAHACFYQGIPYVIIRAISDSADDHAEADYTHHLDRVAIYACEMVSDIIKNAQHLL